MVDHTIGICGVKNDLWGLGVLLYCMVFGHLPLYQNSGDRMLSNIEMQMIIMNPTMKVLYPAWFSNQVATSIQSQASDSTTVEAGASGSGTATLNEKDQQRIMKLHQIFTTLLEKDPTKRSLDQVLVSELFALV